LVGLGAVSLLAAVTSKAGVRELAGNCLDIHRAWGVAGVAVATTRCFKRLSKWLGV